MPPIGGSDTRNNIDLPIDRLLYQLLGQMEDVPEKLDALQLHINNLQIQGALADKEVSDIKEAISIMKDEITESINKVKTELAEQLNIEIGRIKQNCKTLCDRKEIENQHYDSDIGGISEEVNRLSTRLFDTEQFIDAYNKSKKKTKRTYKKIIIYCLQKIGWLIAAILAAWATAKFNGNS